MSLVRVTIRFVDSAENPRGLAARFENRSPGTLFIPADGEVGAWIRDDARTVRLYCGYYPERLERPGIYAHQVIPFLKGVPSQTSVEWELSIAPMMPKIVEGYACDLLLRVATQRMPWEGSRVSVEEMNAYLAVSTTLASNVLSR